MNNNGRFFRFISLILALIITITSFDISTLAADDYMGAGETGDVLSEENIYGDSAEYKVTVSANGGYLSEDDSSLTVTVGEKYGKNRLNNDLPLPTREGYLFGGWNFKSDGTGEYIDENSTVIKTEPHYIYAKWVEVKKEHKKSDGTIGGTCGPDATWKIENNGTLTIEGSGATKNYTLDEVPWKDYKDRVIKYLVVNTDITSIGTNMFNGCELLTYDPNNDYGSIDLKNVTEIGNGAFNGCKNITSVASNAKIKSIGAEAFYGCERLKSITITTTPGSEFNTIGERAFSLCSSLEKVELGAKSRLTTIPKEAFYGCKSLKEVTIPDAVTYIYSAAFKGCGELKEVRIPNGTTYIADDAFDGSTTSDVITTTIYVAPGTEGEKFVYQKAKDERLEHYFIYAKVIPTTSIPEFKFEGSPLSLLKDPKTGVETFNIVNKDKYIDISYQLVSPYDKNNGLDRDGNLRYLDDDGVLELQVTINDNGHWLGTKEKITAKVKVTLPSNFKVYYEPGEGVRTEKSSASVKPFHVIPYSERPSDPVHRYTAFNNNKTYQDTFLGWFRDPVDENTKWDMRKDTVSGNMTLYAHWALDPQYVADKNAKEEEEQKKREEEAGKITVGELTISGVGKKTKVEFTGKPITFPDMKVYCGDTLLVKGVDYTVKYENNVNVSKDALIKIYGKGNYSEVIEIPFEITVIDLVKRYNEGRINIDEVTYYNFTGDRIEGRPVVKLEKDGKYITLKSGRDYTYEYPDGPTEYIDPNDPNDPENKKDPYIISIVGGNNYKGTIKVHEIITKGILITDKKVGLKFGVKYDNEGNPIAVVSVPYFDKYGQKHYRDLVKDKDYTVEDDEENCVLIVKGIGKYSGIKKIAYGTPINKTTIKLKTPAVSLFYTGEEVTPEFEIYDKKNPRVPLKGCLRGKMEEDVKYDYVYEYVNNIKAGKAKIVVKGRGKYRGIANKTFTIRSFDLYKNQLRGSREIKIHDIANQTMLKGGVKPKVIVEDVTYTKAPDGTISSNTIVLVEGKDYKLSYVNNKNKGVSSLLDKAPAVKVTGIGNYKNKLKQNFTIVQSDISKFDESQIMISDIIYREKANICKPKITVRDSDSKLLSANKDYNAVTSFKYAADCSVKQKGIESTINRKKGDLVNRADIIPVNTKIEAVVKAKSGGNYKGEISKIFRIIDKPLDISKATATANRTFEYTGKPITLKTTDITVVLGDVQLDNTTSRNAEFEILGYENNTKCGSAIVYIRGKEGKTKTPYGGIKKVKFTITPKRIQQ